MPASVKTSVAASKTAKKVIAKKPAGAAKAVKKVIAKKPAAAANVKKVIAKTPAKAKAKAKAKKVIAKEPMAKAVAKKPKKQPLIFIPNGTYNESNTVDPARIRYQCIVCGEYYKYNDVVTEIWNAGNGQVPFRYCGDCYAGGNAWEL